MRARTAGAALIWVAMGCAGPQTTRRTTSQRADFALNDTTGHIVHLSDYLGRDVVLLNFWATWCTPCAAELPHLNRLYTQYKDQGLVVLGIAMDGPETVANVAPAVRHYNLEFPVLLDEETRVIGTYNPKRTAPFSILIGRDSNIAKTREGYMPGDEAALESEIVQLLSANRK